MAIRVTSGDAAIQIGPGKALGIQVADGLDLGITLGAGGLPPLPSGFVFLIDNDGAVLKDRDGAYLLERA